MTAAESPIAEAMKSLLDSDQIKNRYLLPDDEAWVVARTMLAPWVLLDQDEKVLKRIVPPNGNIGCRFIERGHGKTFTKLWMAVERIKKYLAYSYGAPLPFYYFLVRKTLLWPHAEDVQAVAYYPVELLFEPGPPTAPWFDELRRCYTETQRLLDHVRPDSYVDRAISLVGAAYWVSDVEERFLYSWRALDVLAAEDFSMARSKRSSEPTAAHAYIDRHTEVLLSGKVTRISGYTKALVALQRRVPEFDEAKANLNRLYYLRGVVAHGSANTEQFEEIRASVGGMLTLAHRAVRSRIVEARLNDP